MPDAMPKILEEALESWLDAQRQAVELLRSSPQPGHPVDWGEGARWVTRTAALAQEWVVEYADPLRPTIFHSQGPTRKLMVDNPDVDYWFATLSEHERYRLSGTRGDAPAIGLTIGTDVIGGTGGGPAGTLVQNQVDDFEIAADGSFSIELAKERPAGARNWIPLPEGAAQIAVRETFQDRSQERPAQLHIERLGEPLPPLDWTPEVAAARLKLASRYLLFVANSCVGMWRAFSRNYNVIQGTSGADHAKKRDDAVRSHSATDMAYMGGCFKLEPGQALRVTIHPAEGGEVYWGLTLVNPWMESYEYRQRKVCTNNGLAARNADGTWTVVICAEDPGHANWLDTGGRREGYALLRWVLPASLPPQPTCEVVGSTGA